MTYQEEKLGIFLERVARLFLAAIAEDGSDPGFNAPSSQMREARYTMT